MAILLLLFHSLLVTPPAIWNEILKFYRKENRVTLCQSQKQFKLDGFSMPSLPHVVD